MPTTFHIHTRPRAHALQAPWGWVTRDPDAAGGTVAHWYDVLPSPGHHPGARVERYSRYKAVDARCRRRIVGADGRHILDGIPDESTAHELLAWLCPKE